MNYIKLVNQFWLLNREYYFKPNEIALYFHLLNVSNLIGWKNPFKEGNRAIAAAIGVCDSTLQRSRDRLVEAGLIGFKSGKVKRELTEYTLIDPDLGIKNLYLNGDPSSTQSAYLSDTQSSKKCIDNTKQKEKEIKQNQTKQESDLVFPFCSEEFKKIWQVWNNYRTQRKISYKNFISEQAALKQLSSLANGSEAAAIAIVEQSLANQWQGLFELKTTTINAKNNGIINTKGDARINSERIDELFDALVAGKQ